MIWQPAPWDQVALGWAPALAVLVSVAALLGRRSLDLASLAQARLIENSRDGIVTIDAAGQVVHVNPAAERLVGEEAASLVGRRFDDAFAGSVDLAQLSTDVDRTLDKRPPTTKAGERQYRARAWPLLDDGGKECGTLVVFRDITAEKDAEAALRTSEERLRIATEQMPAILWTTDADLRFTQMLGAGLKHLGVRAEAVTGVDLYELFGTIDETHIAIAAHKDALEGFPSTYSVQWFGRDFECHVEPLLDEDGTPKGTIGVGLDVTEREDLHEQLRQSQKMEAIGRMAGGVAHDFNNLLTAVTGYARLAQEDLEGLEAEPGAIHHLRRDIDAIEHASERATAITAQLLAFSRRQVLQPRLLDLADVINDMETMVRRLMGTDIELITSFDAEIDPIRADPVQIQQVVINLILNARDAMPSGGKIFIAATNTQLDQTHPVRYDVVEPGDYVTLVVRDQGGGIDEQTLPHIFEPFFTTKEKGKGTGLGLSTVYGIVKQTGGHIEVESEVGGGTTFKVFFPVPAAGEPEIVSEAPAPASTGLEGTETILLVEDEEMVRVLATRVLNGNGYLVLEAEDGEEALEACRRHEGPIDLVITDVVMPGMNGRELADKLAEVLPGTAVLFISGYTGGALVEHGVIRDGTEFLQKPFSPHRLMQKVREVLDKRTGIGAPI